MKNILFVCYGLGIGGIEKCLVNLLNAMPKEKFNIDVLLMNPEFNLKQNVYDKVNFIDSFNYVMNTTDTMHAIAEHGGVSKNFSKFLKYCIFRLKVKLDFNPWKAFKRLPDEYDIAVAYSQNDFSPYYVIDKVKAKRKILWYHNGAYERSDVWYNRDKIYYNKFDKIVAVSNDCKKMLDAKFKFDKEKVIVLRNVCDVRAIKENAVISMPESFNKKAFHITTVGRLTEEKGCNLAIEACTELVKKGFNVIWHWVGDGNQRENAEKLIDKNDLKECFILEGNQNNPYTYILNADLYVQPSYYEAYSTTVTEARVLCKPIVTTDVGGMRDQINNNENGFIVPIDSKAIADMIEQLLNNTEDLKRISTALKKESVDMQNPLKEYYETVFR